MHPEDTNVLSNEIIVKYANRPDDLEKKCHADFATGCVNVNTKDVVKGNDTENYTTPVSNSDEEQLSEGKIIVLKNRFRKRGNKLNLM